MLGELENAKNRYVDVLKELGGMGLDIKVPAFPQRMLMKGSVYRLPFEKDPKMRALINEYGTLNANLSNLVQKLEIKDKESGITDASLKYAVTHKLYPTLDQQPDTVLKRLDDLAGGLSNEYYLDDLSMVNNLNLTDKNVNKFLRSKGFNNLEEYKAAEAAEEARYNKPVQPNGAALSPKLLKILTIKSKILYLTLLWMRTVMLRTSLVI